MGFLSLLPLCLGLLAILPRPLESLEPLTMGAIGFGALGLGTYFKEHTYCRFTECCDDRSIPADTGCKYMLQIYVCISIMGVFPESIEREAAP